MNFRTTLTNLLRDTDVESSKSGSERDQPEPASEAKSGTDFDPSIWYTKKETLFKLIESQGGRMQQTELVDRTGWSKSSVSRHLSELEADGVITRFKFGRTKIVLFPDDPRMEDLSDTDITD